MRQGARLGQHFLKNPHYAEVLAHEAGITTEDIVLEIGPGEGMLTKELLRVSKKVLAVEKDEALAEKLPQIFPQESSNGRLRVLSMDVRDFDPTSYQLQASSYILAANIPYYITGELLRKFLETHAQPKTIAFLIQKEVAQRIIDTKESILSISVKAYGTPRIAAKVSAGNFNPPPKVDSAILVVDQISKGAFENLSEEHFFHVVRAGFASKRKLLLNNLASVFGKEKVAAAFEKLSIDPNTRAEEVHAPEWLSIARSV